MGKLSQTWFLFFVGVFFATKVREDYNQGFESSWDSSMEEVQRRLSDELFNQISSS